jgi:hypothetical protein
MTMKRLMWVGMALVLAGRAQPAAAQVLAGSEFRVNVLTVGSQLRPSLAVRPDGEFVVVFDSVGSDGASYGIVGRRFDATGSGLGGEFQVNTYTTGMQFNPWVDADAKGNFVVVWTGPDGSANGVFGQRFDATGVRRGGEFRVNTYTTYNQSIAVRTGPLVASAADGRFVVAWTNTPGLDGSGTSTHARRYDAQGVAQGDEFQVNTFTTAEQNLSSLSMAADGTFVVGFSSYAQDGNGFSAVVKRYDATGSAMGAEFVVNTATIGGQYAPIVNMADDHGFVVHFHQTDGSSFGIRARVFRPGGNPLGAEFQVNTQTAGFQYGYASGRDAADAFVIAWSDMQDVFVRRFLPDGTPRGDEFRVNTYTTSLQVQARAASDEVGNLVMAWSSFGQDGSGQGVFAQRLGGLRPAALSVNTAGNLVWEPGESVDMRPAWRNVNGAPQTFSGTLTNLTGPAGATYTLVDGTGGYGTVPNNTSAPCTDCYAVQVDTPSPRPAQHWDAGARETISPDAQGQQKSWRLHIGGSFDDVPATNPFYRFVETLLHFSITGGCGGLAYCPGSATTRAQMSVFVLVAREGAGYTPPGCVPPNVFSDVPETSPFCRFVEELFNRGVVVGCGPGPTYCPDNPVTREQMAVFVLRTLDPALIPPACAPPNLFADVPETSPFCRWIEELANRGVVSGCGGGNYCPQLAVTREQMGVFISVTFSLSLYGP